MKDKSSNFELMRICSMFLIVLGHTLSWGGIVEHADSNTKFIIYLIYGFIVVHVNSFILLTGYFQSTGKFKIKKIINLICLMLFYRIIFYTISVLLGWQPFYGVGTFIYNLLPIDNYSYWFLNIYIVLYMLSPYLNKLINNIEKGEYIKLLGILFIFCSVLPRITLSSFFNNNAGYSLIQFIFMYLIGAFIRKYDKDIKLRFLKIKLSFNDRPFNYFIIYFVLVVIKFLINYCGNILLSYNGLTKIIGNNLAYSYTSLVYDSPIVIIISVAYFLMFKNLSIRNSKFINRISKTTNEIYLFHMNIFFKSHLYLFFGLNLLSYRLDSISRAIYISIIIMFCGFVIYYIRTFFIKIFRHE